MATSCLTRSNGPRGMSSRERRLGQIAEVGGDVGGVLLKDLERDDVEGTFMG